MGRRSLGRLVFFLVVAFGLTVAGVILQRSWDGVLRTEQWAADILAAAQEAGLEDPYLLAGLIHAESRGIADAVSSIGALGLCQLLPTTAADMARRYDVEGPPFTPAQNILLGAHYLREQLDRFRGNVDLALLAFRLGHGAVQRRIQQSGGEEKWLTSLKQQKPSPWDYRTQVLRFQERFRERAEAGVGWPVLVAAPGAGR